jgi:hypothetical protein
MMMIVFNWNNVAFENNNKNVVLDDQTQQVGFHEINKTWTYKVYQHILNRFFHLNFCSLSLNNGKILWMWVILGPCHGSQPTSSYISTPPATILQPTSSYISTPPANILPPRHVKFTSKENSLTSLQQQWLVKQSDMLEHNITYSRQM